MSEETQDLSKLWWCPECECYVPWNHVTFEETHDTREGGCGVYVLSSKPKAEDQEIVELRAEVSRLTRINAELATGYMMCADRLGASGLHVYAAYAHADLRRLTQQGTNDA